MATDAAIAELFSVTQRTVRYWRKHGFPAYAAERLSLTDGTHPDWNNFQIHPGYITTPSGQIVTKGEIELYHWVNGECQQAIKRCSVIEDRLRKAQRVCVAANENTSFDSLAKLLNYPESV